MVLACAVAGCSGSDDTPGAADQPPGATQTAAAPGTSGTVPGAQPTDPAATEGAPDDAPATPGGTPPGSGGASEGDGSEVIPQPQDTPRLDELYDDAPSAEPLAEAPADGSATGELVDGFPVGVIDLVPDATVTASAVSAEGQRVQVSLEATAPVSPDEVLGHYRARFVAGGFAEAAVPAVDGTTAAAFSRSGDSLVVSSRTSGDETVFSVTGVLVVQG